MVASIQQGWLLFAALVLSTRIRLDYALQSVVMELHSTYMELNKVIEHRILSQAETDERCLAGAPLPVISMNELLCYNSSNRTASSEISASLRAKLRQGCCIVDTTTSGAQHVGLDGMFDIVENELFSGEDLPSTLFRHEAIRRANKPSTDDDVGYEYAHFQPSEYQQRHQYAPKHDSQQELAQRIGSEQYQKLQHSFEVLFNIACTYSGLVLETCHHGMDATRLVAEWRQQGSSFQRLMRYLPSQQHRSTTHLQAHCDWTLVTLIPISQVPGLQVHTDQGWVQAERHKGGSGVVVLIGKWLEILTGGSVESTIHRVILPEGDAARYSAPFFFRLNGNIEDVHLFDTASNSSLRDKLLCVRNHLLRKSM